MSERSRVQRAAVLAVAWFVRWRPQERFVLAREAGLMFSVYLEFTPSCTESLCGDAVLRQ